MYQSKPVKHQPSFKALLSAGLFVLVALFAWVGSAQASTPQASAGSNSSCALSAYGTVWCWGDNSSGQLGHNGSGLIPRQVAGLTDVSSVATGKDFACALKSDQTVWCWGDNAVGSLGNGKNVDSTTPVQVSGLSGIAQISTSGSNGTVCARSDSGEAWCWGDNAYGQLGDNSTTNRSVPVKSSLSNVSKIVSGPYSTCALLGTSQIRCWGKGWYGQLGNGYQNDSNTPVTVSGISSAVDLDLGAGHACAITSDGDVKCWGYNLVGQLGDGTNTNRLVATAVDGLSGVTQISLGAWHSCALLGDGTVKCWGLNSANTTLGSPTGFSQLGDGSSSDSASPVAVDGISGASWIGAGHNTTCAVTDSGTRCWGDNTSGQVGVGYASPSGAASSSSSSVFSFPLSTQDSTAPDAPTWTQPDPTSQTSISLAYATSEPGGATECRLDQGDWESCTSFDGTSGAYALADLSEGTHTVEVRQTDISDNISQVGSVLVVVDRTAPLLPTVTPVADPSNLAAQTLQFTLSESGGTTECRLDDGEWGACTSVDGTSGSMDTGNLLDGQHTLHVRQTDGVGNTSSEAGYTWTIDTVAPDVPTITPLADPLSNAGPTILFALNEEGGTVECKLDDAEWSACTSVEGLDGTYQTADLTEGPHTFQVRQTDQAGNTGEADSMTWTVDTQAPTAPVVDQPETPTQNVSPTVSFTLGEADGIVECKLNDGAWGDCTSIDGTSGTYETDSLDDGYYTLYVRQTDAAHNTSEVASVSWEVDTQAPKTPEIVKFFSPSNNTSPNISFKLGESGGTLECKLDDAEWGACENQDGASGTYQTSELADGEHTIQVKHTDQVGNVSRVGSWTWSVDTQAPAAPTITPISTPNHHASTTLYATLAESSGSAECQLDDGAWTACTARSGVTVALVVKDLTDGEHTFQVRQTDTAGNTGEPDSATWTLDTQAPSIPQITPLADPNNDANPVLNFQLGESGGTVQCKFDSKAWGSCTSIDGTEGVYDPESLPDGPHTLKVRQSDPAGNSSLTAVFSWVIDTVPPRTPVVNAVASPNKVNTQTVRFTLGQTVGTTECKIDEGDWGSCSSVSGKLGTHDTGVLADGAHTVQVRQTDLADNTSAPGSVSWTIDTQAPAAPVLTQSPASKAYINSAVFAWTGENGAVAWCMLDGKAWSVCTSSKTLSKLSPGDHSFAIKLIDAAGNNSASTTTNWNYSEPPVPAVVDFDLTDESAALAYTITNDSKGKTAYTTSKNLVYSITFDRPVTGLTASDFLLSGTSPKWAVQSVTGSAEGPYLVTVSNPSGGDGTMSLSLNFKTVASVSAGILGPGAKRTASTAVVLDRAAPVAPRLSGLPTSRTAAQSLAVVIAAESGAALTCSLDGAAYSACSSPWNVTGLDEGVHTVQVKQTDLAGNTSSAGSGSWTVHILPPDAPTLSAKPVDNSDKAAALWFSGESKATFQCRVDSGSWQACVSPFVAQGLGSGSHTLQVKQTDELGKTSAPAETTWDTAPPGPAETAKSRITRSGKRLTCSLLSSAPGGSTLGWQWFAEGQLIGNGTTFDVPDATWGKDVFCVAAVKTGTATRGYQSEAWNEALPKPSFTARLALNRGKRLAQSYITGWSFGPILSTTYQWSVNGVVVPGASGASYTWSAGDSGKNIVCTITLTNASGSTSTNYTFKA